jgi:hypothetical protein
MLFGPRKVSTEAKTRNYTLQLVTDRDLNLIVSRIHNVEAKASGASREERGQQKANQSTYAHLSTPREF